MGMIAAVGEILPSPNKVRALSHWPAPVRHEDLERFLATIVFIGHHITPCLSELVYPLRVELKKLAKMRKEGKVRGKAKYKPVGDQEKTGRPSWWTDALNATFEKVKQACVFHIDK